VLTAMNSEMSSTGTEIGTSMKRRNQSWILGILFMNLKLRGER
jgi:hypothetical protein